MDHIYRVAACVLVLLSFAVDSFASSTSPPMWRTPTDTGIASSSALCACGGPVYSTAWCNANAGVQTRFVTTTNAQSGRCEDLQSYAGASWLAGFTSTQSVCAAGGVLSGSAPNMVCTYADCPAGQTRQSDGTCKTSCPSAGTRVDGIYGNAYSGSGVQPATLCVNGCSYNWGSVSVQLSNTWSTFAGKATGESCSTSSTGTNGTPTTNQNPATPLNTTAAGCIAKGQEYGTVNGQTVCTGPGSNVATRAQTSASSSANSGPTTTVDTYVDTSCVGDTCTSVTKTVSNGPSGPSTSVSGFTESKSDFCTQNPKSAQCSNTSDMSSFCKDNPKSPLCLSSSFTGSCDSEPSCEGDAATCAIAKATWSDKCMRDELKTQSATSDLFDANNPAGDGSFQQLSQKALNKDGAADFDIFAKWQEKRQNYIDITASCPATGLHFDFKGKTYNFDTGFVCDLGDFVRLLMHIGAYMMVVRLLSRTFA